MYCKLKSGLVAKQSNGGLRLRRAISIQAECVPLLGGSDCHTRRAFVLSKQARKFCLLQNQPFTEAPGASASLVFEVNPMRPGTRMPKGLPEHREIIAIRAKPNDMLDTDPIGIAASKPVRDAQRAAIALAPSAQKALIPSAWCQLIPDEGGYAARLADGQPSWSLATRVALPPISGH